MKKLFILIGLLTLSFLFFSKNINAQRACTCKVVAGTQECIEFPGGQCPTGESCECNYNSVTKTCDLGVCHMQAVAPPICPGECRPASGCEPGETPKGHGPQGCPPHMICCLPSQQVITGEPFSLEECSVGGVGGYITALGCIPTEDPSAFVTWLLKTAIGLAGGIAILLIIFGGFLVILSSGDPQRLQTGKDILTSAIIGLLIIIFSVFLLRIIGVEILMIPDWQ